MADLPWVIKELNDVLWRLASDAEVQIQYLSSIGDPRNVDELALELDDIEPLLPQVVEAGLISPDTAQQITDVGNQLRTMSGEENAILWTQESLKHSEEWERVRQLARQAAKDLTQQ